MTLSQTADVNSADLACRSTSPSIEEVEQMTSTDQNAIEGDRPDEVINQTRRLDEQPTVEQQVAARPDDNMSHRRCRTSYVIPLSWEMIT